jgi:hypothetical protein
MEIDYYLLGLRVLELQVVLLGGEIVVRIGNKKRGEIRELILKKIAQDIGINSYYLRDSNSRH